MMKFQPSARPVAKTKTEMREMLAEAVRNTQPEPTKLPSKSNKIAKLERMPAVVR